MFNIKQYFLDNFWYNAPLFPLWLGGLFVFGVGLYFSFSFEPNIDVLLYIMATLIITLVISFKYILIRFLLYCMLSITTGALSTTIHAHQLFSPKLTADNLVTYIVGEVESINENIAYTSLVIINPELYSFRGSTYDGLVPHRIRLSVRTSIYKGIKRGDVIGALAKISSIKSNGIGFDIQRYLYFKQIGASGFTLGMVDLLSENNSSSVIDIVRDFIAKQINKNMQNSDAKNIALALMIGDMNRISQETTGYLRGSGLVHIISVSGLHMTLVIAISMYIFRKILVLCRIFIVYNNSKNIAAVLAVVVSVFYLLISGMQVATVRSFIMSLIFMFGQLFERKTLSIYSLVYTAVIILSYAPESIMLASFQMSFAAVMGLGSVYSAYYKYRKKFAQGCGKIKKLIFYCCDLIFCSFVAGFYTNPYSVFHFNYQSNYSILSNLIATPLTSVFIMPLLVIIIFMTPLGLDRPFYVILEWSIISLIKIAEIVYKLPGSTTFLANFPEYILVLTTVAFVLIAVVRGVLKYLCIIPIVCIACYFLFKPNIVLFIDFQSKIFAVPQNGVLYLSGKKLKKSKKELWKKISASETTENIKKCSTCRNNIAILCNKKLDLEEVFVKIVNFKRFINKCGLECEDVDQMVFNRFDQDAMYIIYDNRTMRSIPSDSVSDRIWSKPFIGD